MRGSIGQAHGRKEGAPFGNRNRLRHGRYGRARAVRRGKVRALIRATRVLIRRIELIARARAALRQKRIAQTAANAN